MEECCPKFDPEPWDGKTINWKNKRFIKDRVFTLFHVPLNFSSVMKRMNRNAEKAGAKFPDNLCLSDHTSKWNMDLYLAVDRAVPGCEMAEFSGRFICKAYEGEFSNMGRWMEDFARYVAGKGIRISKQYVWYTTCPKCAKKYGKNYVVFFGKE